MAADAAAEPKRKPTRTPRPPRVAGIHSPPRKLPKYSRIEDYAMIGDLRTAALVSSNGSIDWLCLPRFDSDSCFSAILGDARHGRWQIKPRAQATVTRGYVDGSLILESVYKTRSGSVRLIDFMPVGETHTSLVRQIVGIEGSVEMSTDIAIRFDYGFTVPWVTALGNNVYQAVAGSQMLTMRSGVQMHGEGMRSRAEFTVAAGETVEFVLTNTLSYGETPRRLNVDAARRRTETFWRRWANRCSYRGEHQIVVQRSLVTLKGLTYLPTGGIVAAPTTSLPEELGGSRNWDYRYCWVRDATFTLLAFMNAGYHEEAATWRDWLLRAVAGSPEQLQIMYGLAGERQLQEWEVPWLPGYRNSGPVRIGNAAAGQKQLDVYGELMDALVQARVAGMAPSEHASVSFQVLLEHLETIWREPDSGIWEIRGEPKHFVHSKVMVWLAFHRAANAPQMEEGRRARYAKLSQKIRDEVCRNGMDPTGSHFVQYYGATELDASLLLLAIVGFLPPDDPRIRNTVEQIERQLMPEGLVLRYRPKSKVDGLTGAEGVFLACSFWLVDNFVLLGRVDDAHALFRKLVGLSNDVGLLSEEYDPKGKRMLGNFPQAFSHVALVNSAIGLDRAIKLAEEHRLSVEERKTIQKTVYRHAMPPAGKKAAARR